jgi:hypothetical protein
VFQVRAPAVLAPGVYEVRAVARDSAGRRYSSGLSTVEYPHIRIRSWLRDGVSAVHAAPIALPAVARVGYIRGASDRVPEALLDIGLPLEILDAAALERGDLSRYDVIVVGSRAYETDPALVENNTRLLEYARAGGRVMVQYQQGTFFNGRFAPAPLTVAQPHDRVTDENARGDVARAGQCGLRALPTGWPTRTGRDGCRSGDSTLPTAGIPRTRPCWKWRTPESLRSGAASW